MKNALVVLVVGDKYIAEYNKYFKPSHERFAKKYNLPLIIFERYIDALSEGKRHPSWQKLLIFEAEETKEFDRLCWIDADIYITAHAKNPFDFVAADEWGMVKNDLRGMDYYIQSDLNNLQFCPQDNRPQYLYNGGFFIATRKQHASILRFVYDKYDLPYFDFKNSFEQAPLSYHIHNCKPGKELGFEFNAQVLSYCILNGSSVWGFKTFYLENSFLHFVGGTSKDWLPKVLVWENNNWAEIMKLTIFDMVDFGKEGFFKLFRRLNTKIKG